MLALNNLLAAEGLTDLESTNARQQLRLLLRTTRWRDVVPKIPLTIPESLIAPLKQKCEKRSTIYANWNRKARFAFLAMSSIWMTLLIRERVGELR